MAEFSLELNDDQKQIRDWVHEFAETVIRPAGEEWDEREETPWPIIEEAAKIGLYGFDFMANAMMGDPTGLTLPVAMEELFWGDAGIVELSGPVLATGYLGDDGATAAAFVDGADGRWFRTSDLGALVGGVLRVIGRADDVVITGGVNVAPAAVEAVLGEVLTGEVCVVGVPHDEWGQELVAVLADAVGARHAAGRSSPTARRAPTAAGEGGGSDELARVRSVVAARLGPAAAPRRIVRVDSLPLRGPGKVDRAAVVDLVRAHVARD